MTRSAGFQPAAAPTTLVVGLGNPILGDDGVGWRVAEAFAATRPGPDVEVICLSVGGLALMEHLAGYRRALIVDAVVTGAPPGTLHAFSAAQLADRSSHHTASVHDLGLAVALDLGRQLGLELPEDLHVLGIEAAPGFEFGETLAVAVEGAVGEAVRWAGEWLSTNG